MTAKKAMNDMLWKSIEKTDPAFAKNFNRGGFKGTAINPTYVAFKLTQALGPIGHGWGFSVIDEKYQEGAVLERVMTGPETAALVRETIHVVRIMFWTMIDGQRGEFEAFGQTTFVGKNKRGIFTDEEAPKKSLTDAFTKAAAQLGASADIHMGRYDDSKYVSDRRQEFGSSDDPIDPGPPQTGSATNGSPDKADGF